MLQLNDKVRVTKEAREDTYDNAWWTKKELVIDHIHEDKSVTEYEERVYSFKDIDGKEVPVSLYEYELELIDSATPEEIRERLEHRYELGEYDVDANIEEEEEIRFLESICDDFYRGRSDLDTLIRENMDSFFGYSFEEKLELAKYIEEHIDEFISSCGVNNFRQALDGGIREYLFAQFFSNAETIYANLIYMKLNEVLENITEYKEEMLSESDAVFLNFDSSEVEDMVEDFINSEIYTNCVYDKSADDLYSEFCKFVSDEIVSDEIED